MNITIILITVVAAIATIWFVLLQNAKDRKKILTRGTAEYMLASRDRKKQREEEY